MARIGLVIYSLVGGGAERMAINLSHEFVKQGHIVDFLLGSEEGIYLKLVPNECKVYSSKLLGATHWRKTIQTYIEIFQPIVLLGMMEGASMIALQASLRSKFKVPVVARIPNHFSTHCRHSPRWKERYLMPLAAKWYFPKAKKIIAISNGVKTDVIEAAWLDPSKVVSIYNPAVKSLISCPRAQIIHPWLNPERKWIAVVTAGRLTTQKEQDVLIKAIYLANFVIETRLIVLGQGEKEMQLREQAEALDISAKVDFFGFVDNPSDYFSQADVFALSSAWEGFGNVLVEALASGTAVVSTDCPSGPAEILANGQFGQLVPVGDSQNLADAIVRARDYPIDKGLLAAHLQQFKSSVVAHEYLRVMGVETS